MCIQTELDRLTNEINILYPDLKIAKYTIKNPYDFIDKKIIKIPSSKPSLPINFSICTVKYVDYIQFCKIING